jgi:hypothetical protein
MAKTIRINGISESNINDAAQELRKYAKWVSWKEAELITKLAERGRRVAELNFTLAMYNGTNVEDDITVSVDENGSSAVIYAKGSAVAFIEFGSGAKEGYGHPDAGKHGFGPSTWSLGDQGKGHWDDPNGWYYAHGKKTHGNPPAMAMWQAVQTMTEELTTIAKEVFGSPYVD